MDKFYFHAYEIGFVQFVRDNTANGIEPLFTFSLANSETTKVTAATLTLPPYKNSATHVVSVFYHPEHYGNPLSVLLNPFFTSQLSRVFNRFYGASFGSESFIRALKNETRNSDCDIIEAIDKVVTRCEPPFTLKYDFFQTRESALELAKTPPELLTNVDSLVDMREQYLLRGEDYLLVLNKTKYGVGVSLSVGQETIYREFCTGDTPYQLAAIVEDTKAEDLVEKIKALFVTLCGISNCHNNISFEYLYDNKNDIDDIVYIGNRKFIVLNEYSDNVNPCIIDTQTLYQFFIKTSMPFKQLTFVVGDKPVDLNEIYDVLISFNLENLHEMFKDIRVIESAQTLLAGDAVVTKASQLEAVSRFVRARVGAMKIGI